MKRVILLTVVAALAVSLASAHAGQRAIVAGPSANRTGWATPATIHRPGDPLSLVNADTAFHAVGSEAKGSDDQPWCGPLNPGPEHPATNPRRFARGQCPLFYSDLAAPLTGVVPVLGVDLLIPGRAYPFGCRVHADMGSVIIAV